MPEKKPEKLPEAEKNYYSSEELFSEEIGYVRAFVHRDYNISLHAHDFIEVNFVLSGDGLHYILDKRFPVSQGYVFVITPDTKHGYVSEHKLDVFHLLIHTQFFKKYELNLKTLPGFLMLFTVEPFFREETGFRYSLRLNNKSEQMVIPMLKWLEICTREPCRENRLEMEIMALWLITHLSRQYQKSNQHMIDLPKNKSQVESVNNVLFFMSKKFREKITLDQLAGKANMQREYFCRVFRKITGSSPLAHLTQLRVQEARRLLLETDMPINTIALEVGFYDSSHLTRSFSKIMGCSPKHMRKRSM